MQWRPVKRWGIENISHIKSCHQIQCIKHASLTFSKYNIEIWYTWSYQILFKIYFSNLESMILFYPFHFVEYLFYFKFIFTEKKVDITPIPINVVDFAFKKNALINKSYILCFHDTLLDRIKRNHKIPPLKYKR